MSENVLVVAKSPVAGYGVFATKFIPFGTPLAEFTGEYLTPKEIKERYGNYRYCYRRPFQRTWICSRETPNIINYVNGAGFGKTKGINANVVLKRRWLWALRDIIPGEELLLNYPRGYDYNAR